MVLQHVALTVNDSEEIENFYEDILLFKLRDKFLLKKELAQKIFNVRATTDVYIMDQMELQFEIFLSSRKEKRVFSHICMTYTEPEMIYHKAVDKGYKTALKQNPMHDTFFIWDHSGNLFELKYTNPAQVIQ